MTSAVVISVFGLFHPAILEVQPARNVSLAVACPGAPTRTLEGAQSLRLTAGCAIAKRSRFILSVPGRIRREFEGSLRIAPGLTALIEMDLETAVASVVAAEMPHDAPAEALAAQAIAARSFYAAHPGVHVEASFCDTTHCQHMKAVVEPNHPAARAAAATKGLILEYGGRTLQAMYSAGCQGRRQGGELDGYPYAAVECAYCRRKPSTNRAALHARGLCQSGAIDQARMGKDARAILAHYYPGTRLNYF